MKADIAIITIRPDEFKAVRSRFETEERRLPGGRTYLIGQVKTQDGQTYTVAIARCSDQGNDASQRLAHSIIHHLDPHLILVVGIAGGIPHDDFTLGDVVLSTHIVNPNVDAWHADGTTDYIVRGGPPHPLVEDIISLLPGKPQLADWAASIQPQRPDLDAGRVNIKADNEWREKVRESLEWHFGETENRGRSSTYITGPILSSNHLMKDPARLREILKTHRDIFAVEMEAAGVYEAAYGTSHYPVMAIRGISDIVGLQRDRRWTAYACQAAAAFAHAFIMSNPLKLRTAVGCPYRGLDAFTENDHEFFFGRQRDIDRLLHKLRGGSHFMAVLGPSGGGKSSLIQAGLIRGLRNGALPGSANWEYITSRPANDPFAHLAAKGFAHTANNLLEGAQAWRVRHPEKERLVLVLDQFEELWTSCSPELADEFVIQLTHLLKAPYHDYITLIVIMRDDFYRYSVQNEQFAGLMEQGTVNILPKLRRGEFVDIIEKPASKAGLRFADGLVDTIVEDVLEPMRTPLDDDRYGPNTILPLLEFALTALWNECQRRQGEELTHSGYLTIQGVSGALAMWAEKAYRRIEDRLQPLARHIFTNLVYLDDEKRGLPKSRIRRTMGELCPVNSTPNDVRQVVHQLATERLLVASRDTGGQEWVEIIHDVLVEKWESLRRWLDEDRPFLAWHQELQRRFQLWVETDPANPPLRDEGRLLRGRDLEEAEHWVAERGISIDQMEQDFITLSRKHVERQRQALLARELAAQAEALQQQKTHFLQRSMLLAVEAMLHSPCLEADQALRSRLVFFPRPIARLQHALDDVRAIAFSPDGLRLATAGRDHTARVWEIASGREVAQMRHGRRLYSDGPIFGEVNAVAFSPDGRYIASAGDDRVACVWEALSGEKVALLTHEGPIGAVAFSPDGLYLATASNDRTARIWEVASGEEIARLAHGGIVNAVRFSPDGRYLASGDDDGTAQIWDTVSHEAVARIAAGGAVKAVAFSPDGRYLAVGGKKGVLDGIVVVWETNSRSEFARIVCEGVKGLSPVHEAAVNALAFSPDSASLATANDDWMAHLFEVETDRQLQRFPHEGWYSDRNVVYALAFSPDGRYLATAGGDGTAGVWETQSGRQVACLTGGISVHAVAFSPDGHYLATAGSDRAARIWEMPGTSCFVCFQHTGPVYALAASPDGQYLATGSQDGTARLWSSVHDQGKGEKTAVKSQLEACVPHRAYVGAAAFSPDTCYLATASADHTTRIWQLPGGNVTHHLTHGEEVVDVVFSPDSSYLATASSDHTAGVWETASGQQRFRFEHEKAVTGVAFSPDGRYLATVSEDCTAKIWDLSNGQCKARLLHDYLEHTHAPSKILRDVTFSPDGRFLVTAGGAFLDPGVATLWNVSEGSKVAELTHEQEIRMVAFSPDGRYLATASNDYRAGLWEVSSGRRLATLAHREAVHAVAFSHDGTYLATASWDGTAGIWEVPSGRQLARVTHASRVYAAIFSADDRYVITASEDGTAQAWLWKPQDLINEASSRLTYNLTPGEWRVYLGDEPYRKTRYCPLQEEPTREKTEEAPGEVNARSGIDEVGTLTAHIRQGHPGRADIERLKQYGVACLEELIEQTKMIRGGDAGKARDEVFASMNAEDAFPIVMPLTQNNDRDIRQVAALALCRLQYQDVYKIGNAIGAIGSVLRRAERDDSSEGDKWRLDEAMDILRERREKEFQG